MRILRSYEPGETISFSIIRSREKRTVKVELPDREAMGSIWQWLAPPAPAPARAPAPPMPPATIIGT